LCATSIPLSQKYSTSPEAIYLHAPDWNDEIVLIEWKKLVVQARNAAIAEGFSAFFEQLEHTS